jgi:hypothetical protein
MRNGRQRQGQIFPILSAMNFPQGGRSMFKKIEIAVSTLVLMLSAISMSTSPVLAKKSCFEICNERGGLPTGRQKQACVARCEDNRAGRKQ